MKVRVSATVLGWLEGTQAWAEIDRPVAEQTDDANVIALFRELRDTGHRSDGSITVELELGRALILYEYAGYLESAARDDAGFDPTSRGELNAARALMRQIDRQRPGRPFG